MTEPASEPRFSRRDAIAALGAGILAATGTGVPTWSARATPKATAAAINKLIGGRAAKDGRIDLRLPRIADDGNRVLMTVSVDSPMTARDYVTAIHVFADGNPNPEVASFRFSPASGRARVTTRIRMAKSQNIIAIAEMSDGSVYRAVRDVTVTLGGCGG